MQKSDHTKTAMSAHRRVQQSTTLNRKYVRRPSDDGGDVMVNIKRSPQIKRFSATTKHIAVQSDDVKAPAKQQPAKMAPVASHPVQTAARARMQSRQQVVAGANQAPRLSAQELKEQAIKKALASATHTPTMAKTVEKSSGSQKKSASLHFGVGRVLLALSCAAAAVFAIAYFVNLNMPDLSLRVAAMQTGIEAKYPSYLPRNYKLAGITSEEGKISLSFNSTASKDSFSLEEEKSSWDSNALLSNYVKATYQDNYTIVREQGLTIFVSDSNAAWVNGGIVYKITAEKNVLTNKQIRSIAVSL